MLRCLHWPVNTERDWRLIREECRPAAMQMALDEVATETAARGGPCTVRVYRWQDALSLGYQQEAKTVDWDACTRQQIEVTRRQTGGGGIYHDGIGDISYSIAVPKTAVPGDLLDSYALLCEPILDAFDRMGVDATFATEKRPPRYHPACYLRAIHPAHDIVAGGRKISGNAQYRTRDGILQHGSLSYICRPRRHLSVFQTEVSSASFRERVTSINEQTDIDRKTAVSAVEDALCEWADAVSGDRNMIADDWTADECARATTLVQEKYGSENWVRNRTE